MNSRLIVLSTFTLYVMSTCIALADVSISIEESSPQAEFAAAEIRQVARQSVPEGDWRILLTRVSGSEAEDIKPEGFRIRRSSDGRTQLINVQAIDPAGLLYGGLEVAEVARTLGIEHVENDLQNPYMRMRGTKFNIPLDVRTPSYTDVCDAAQLNIPEMWDIEFWKEYIDTLASYRYNYVSLWNLHPFPSMVKVPAYPEIALQDVWRSNVEWDEDYSLMGKDFVTDKILSDVEIVKEMSIDDKIDFWRSVMAYGKKRNVDFYVVTWNIFTNGTYGKYGITDDYRNATTVDYFRRSVAQMFHTYPDLAGIGLTTGENMPGMDFQAKEDWAMATYGQGVLDAAQQEPDRKITFIHRQHMAKAKDISQTFQPLINNPNVDFIFSFKYAKAHVYSAVRQPYHHSFVDDLGAMETIWTLRNDDVYYFRWGAPDFVRSFVKNIPYDVSRGYYYGSDQYVWGREFLQRHADQPRELEIKKHWYQWMLWGRFAYNPNLGNKRLTSIVADRFAITPSQASSLFEAWQNASMIYPETTGFHWGSLDFQWYIEGCESRASYAQNETGFHDVNRFINLPPHSESECQSIPDFVKRGGTLDVDGKRSPLEVADRLDRYSDRALEILNTFPSTQEGELRRTLNDIRIVATLGAYYADKIRGATQLAIFRESSDKGAQKKSIAHLADAARHWHAYATLALAQHKNPLWTNRVGFVDWVQNYQYTLDDIRIAGGDPTRLGLPESVDAPAEPILRAGHGVKRN